MEALQTYGANVVSFQLAPGDRQWFIVGCYLAPDDASKIEDVVTAISKQPRGGRAVGGRIFQHQPGRTRGPGAGRRDYRGIGRGGDGGHDRPLPPTEQAVVEGRTHMGHVLGRTGGALLDRLHHGHRQLSVPEFSGLGRQAYHGPLPDIGVTPRSRACCAFVIPREVYMLPYQSSKNPGQCRPHVCQTPVGHN